MNMESEEGFVNKRFVVAYQNPMTGREHQVLVTQEDLDVTFAWHKARGNLVSVVPYATFITRDHV